MPPGVWCPGRRFEILRKPPGMSDLPIRRPHAASPALDPGRTGALDRLVAEVYPTPGDGVALHERRPSGTIQATMLVHDLYLRMLKQERSIFRTGAPSSVSRPARCATSSSTTCGPARRRSAATAGSACRSPRPAADDASDTDLLDLHAALDELAAFDPRKAELVQLCAFLGCGRNEAAEARHLACDRQTRLPYGARLAGAAHGVAVRLRLTTRSVCGWTSAPPTAL